MGTALTERAGRRRSRGSRRRRCSARTPTRAGQEAVARGVAALRDVNRARAGRGVEFRIVRLPAGLRSGRRRAARRRRRDARAARATRCRSRASRSSGRSSGDRGADGRDQVLAAAAAAIRPLPPSVLREELVQLVAGRLGLDREPRRERVLAGAAPRGPSRRRATDRPARGRTAPAQALDRREQSERAFLALLPRAARARARSGSPPPTSTSCFSAPATRRAAEYLRGRLRSPAGELPAGDEPLARLVAELVIRAGAARGHAGQARARGPPARPPPPRPPHRRRPAPTATSASATSPPSASRCSTRSATACS